MNSSLLKKALPHIIAIVVFLVVSVAYNKTALEGKQLRQVDVQGYTGMKKQSVDYKEKYGHWPYGLNLRFAGCRLQYCDGRYNGISNVYQVEFGFSGKRTAQTDFLFFAACACFIF